MKTSGFSGKGGPSILNEGTAFWLDFQGLGRPGGVKKREKQRLAIQCFFGVKKRYPKRCF